MGGRFLFALRSASQKMTRNHCGMDFGTSNSTFAVKSGNEPSRLLPLEDGKPTIPSAIFF